MPHSKYLRCKLNAKKKKKLSKTSHYPELYYEELGQQLALETLFFFNVVIVFSWKTKIDLYKSGT